MLPYASNSYGGYSGSYGKKKGIFNLQSLLTGVGLLVVIASLGFAVYSSTRASNALVAKAKVSGELETVRVELSNIRSKLSSRNAEYEHLEATHGHTQRRLTELSSQIQRKEADLASKAQALQQQANERAVFEQHRTARETELSKMVEDLRNELIRSDGIIDALEKKVETMERMHSDREQDWHKLALTWVKYEEDLHEQYKTCTTEVAKLQNKTAPPVPDAPVPEAEPKVRPETDFGHIGVEVPAHHAHHFDPLQLAKPPSPSPAAGGSGTVELPLPEAKIRESIAQMTDGKVGGTQPPSPVSAHHHDVYHGDFEDHGDHLNHHDDHYHGGHYDHYHGHYDAYDPMDSDWLRDAHGDWNADDAAHHTDAHGGGAHDDQHQQQQHAVPEHLQQHHQQQAAHYHDVHSQHRYSHQQHQEQQQHQQPAPAPSPPPAYHEAHDHWQQQQQPPQGQQPQGHVPAHAQHAPGQWQQHQQHQQQQQQDPHQQQYQQYLQQQQQYQQQQQQQQQQQHQQQHQQHHHHHPTGDLAYKMGW